MFIELHYSVLLAIAYASFRAEFQCSRKSAEVHILNSDWITNWLKFLVPFDPQDVCCLPISILQSQNNYIHSFLGILPRFLRNLAHLTSVQVYLTNQCLTFQNMTFPKLFADALAEHTCSTHVPHMSASWPFAPITPRLCSPINSGSVDHAHKDHF